MMKKIIAFVAALSLMSTGFAQTAFSDSEETAEIVTFSAKDSSADDTEEVSLQAPIGLKSVNNTSSSNTFAWTAVDGAEGYEVYYWRSGEFVKIGETADTKYTYSKKSSATKYMYKVRAFKTVNDERVFSDLSQQFTTCTLPSAVKMDSTITSKNSLKLRWSKVSKATGYNVYMYSNGKWVHLADTTKTEFTIDRLESAKQYSFKVRAYRIFNGVTYSGSFSSEKKSYTNKTVKTTRYVTVYRSKNDNVVIGSIPANTVLSQFGAVQNGRIDVKMPKTGKHGWINASYVQRYNNLVVACINQNGYVGGSPMPMGCEATSLATVLNYIGFSTNKNYVSNAYIPHGAVGTVDPNYAYAGSPYTYTGPGVYAPVIAQTANKFLKDRHLQNNYQIELYTDYITGKNVNKEKISTSKLDLGSTKSAGGLTPEQIKTEIDKGHPVIVWMATNGKPMYLLQNWKLTRGQRYTQPGSGSYSFLWYAPQHCLVITGYDDVSGDFIFGDVLTGTKNRRFSYSNFQSSYNILGRQSVVIYKK